MKTIMGRLLLLLGFCLGFVKAGIAFQNTPLQIQHQEPTLLERGTDFELTFTAPGINPNDVQDAYVFYRLKDQMGFNQQSASLMGSDFTVEMSVDDEQATSLVYYFEIHLNNGRTITYPQNQASQEPIEIQIVDGREISREERVKQTGVDYTILSPNPGATVAQNDVVVAITLFYDPAEIDTANTSFQMLVDGQDVTEQANASPYFFTYAPENLGSGVHSTTFKLQKQDSALTIASWSFSVLDPNNISSSGFGGSSGTESLVPGGQVEFLARNQQVGGFANDALSGNVRLSGQKGEISYSAFGLLTSQEDPRLQPQNRYGANLYIGDWLEFEAGHVYPRMSSLTISGQRMQGLNTNFHLWNDALNLQFIYGKLRRGIDNLYENITIDTTSFQSQGNPIYDYSLSTEDGGSGTFQRKVVGGRLGLGRDNNFNFGLNFLKVQDDTNSIRLINDFNALMNTNPDLARNLNDQQMQELQENPGQLSINGNPRPKGNFVAGSDLYASFDSDRIQLQADGAASLLNQDITDGILTQEAAENLGLSIDPETEDLLDQLSWLIIINENMNTLPIRFNLGESGTSAETYFPTGILATQSEIGLNYFDNNLRIRYRWVGPEFNSLANTTVRKDIAGFSVRDRFQLFQNRIYLALGYENLNDNVIDNKDATTHTITYRGNVSWYPIDQDLPRISLGLMNRNRDNDIGLNNPLVAGLPGIPESAAVQNLVVQNGDTLTTPNPRLTNTTQFTASVSQEFSLFGLTHDASINYSVLSTDDQVFNYGNSASNSFSMRVVNRFQDLPLQTNLGFNINNTQTANGLTDIQIRGINVGGSMFLLDDKLNLDAALAYTANSSESTPLLVNANGTDEANDDYYEPNATGSVTESNSYIISSGARYNLNSSHSFLLNFRYSNISNTLSSTAIPDDHLLQFRYIYNF